MTSNKSVQPTSPSSTAIAPPRQFRSGIRLLSSARSIVARYICCSPGACCIRRMRSFWITCSVVNSSKTDALR